MKKYFLIFIFPHIAFCKIIALPELPQELRLLTRSLPEDIPAELEAQYVESFNQALARIAPQNRLFISKSEIYKFVLNKSSKINGLDGLQQIKDNYNKLTPFSQWILSAHLTKDQKELKKSRSYWINELRESLVGSNNLQAQYLELFIHLKEIFEALPEITMTTTSSEIFFKVEQKNQEKSPSQSTEKSVLSNKLNEVFQEN
jgi:hypothetical protein